MQQIEGKAYFKVRDFQTIPAMLAQSVSLYGDSPAVRHRIVAQEAPRTATYRQLGRNTRELAAALLEIGATHGRIAIVGENSYAWMIAYLATVSGVGIVVPLDRLLPADEMLQLLVRGEVDTLFYDAAFHETIRGNIRTLPNIRRCICMRSERLKAADQNFIDPAILSANHSSALPPDLSADRSADPTEIRPPAFLTIESLLDFGSKLDVDRILGQLKPPDPDSVMAILFTSGTTSLAKAVMLSQRNVCADVRGLAGMVSLKQGLRMLSILPLHHTFENTCGLLMALYVGATVHVCDGLRYIQKNMKEYAIEMFIGVPVIFENFYKKIQDGLAKTNKTHLIRRLRPITRALRKVGIDLRHKLFGKITESFGGSLYMGICGAAPVDPEIIRFFDDIGVRVLQGYGLTETSPVVCGCNSKVFVPGTVGQPLPGVTVAINTDQPGESGELLVKGPIVMRGYYKDEEATAAALDQDGWFHTGDMARLDPHTQCITITGRLKSMIVLKSGKKVFPEELEHLVNQFGFIRESMIWGEEDKDGDIVVSAHFVLNQDALKDKQGMPTDERTLQSMLEQLVKDVNAMLPSFKGIRQYVFGFQEMVKTTTMKVKRPVQIGYIRTLMDQQKLRWRELTGKNIDTISKSISAAEAPAPTAKERQKPGQPDTNTETTHRKP